MHQSPDDRAFLDSNQFQKIQSTAQQALAQCMELGLHVLPIHRYWHAMSLSTLTHSMLFGTCLYRYECLNGQQACGESYGAVCMMTARSRETCWQPGWWRQPTRV